MDLKTILEKENHNVDTTLFGYDFCITADRNIYNAIRNKYKALAIAARDKFAKMDEELTDIGDLLDNAPNAFIVAIEDALIEVLQDIVSVDIYAIDKDKIIESAFNGDYFNDFSESFGVFQGRANEIVQQVNDEAYARQLRKDSRPRWTSATIGGNAINAWSHQLDAAGMNLAEGAAYSVINAIGNAITRSWADDELKKLFLSKNLHQDMIDSVYNSCFNLHLLLIKTVKKYSQIAVNGVVSPSDEQKAQAMYNNFLVLNLDEEKRANFINQIFSLNPYQNDFYKAFTNKYGDKNKEFEKFSEFFGINIFEVKNEILTDFVNENLGETEEDAYKCRDKMLELALNIGLDEMLIVQAKAIIDERLAELDLKYRTVDGIVFETREEADTAKSELKKIKKIMSSVSAPTKDSTLSYEKDLSAKKETISSFTTAVKKKYIEQIDKYLKEFDKKFRNETFFSTGMTREEAGNAKALEYVKTLSVNTYENLDIAKEKLQNYLPEVGITLKQAVSATEYLAKCEDRLNTVDGVLFSSRKEADFGREELSKINDIMKDVTPPDSNSLLSYEKHLYEILEQLNPFKTDIKLKYINKVNSYLEKFDGLFRQIGLFKQAATREEAAQDKALKFVRSIAPSYTCDYSMIDKARTDLEAFLPEVGLEVSTAFAANQYLQSEENRLNTVDGVVMSSREEAALAKNELSEINKIMADVVPPTAESLLDYEESLNNKKSGISKYKTNVKLKYISKIDRLLSDFDDKFRRVSLIKQCATREEAARERALRFVKSKAYTTCDDVKNAREELNKLLPKLGITQEQAAEANDFLIKTENKINGVSQGSLFGGFMNKFKK